MREIYLDYLATTPCDPDVLKAMLPYFSEHYGNAASSHYAGRKAYNAVVTAREQVASLLNAQPDEIIFTGSATESNNLVILGLARAYKGSRKKILTLPIEHKSVLEPIRQLEREGYVVGYLPVDRYGLIKEEAFPLIDDQTLLVSVQAANSEIGTIQPIEKIARRAWEVGAIFHSDATQAVGKIPLNVEDIPVDFLSMSGHKLYGPKGIGGLYIRGGSQWGRLQPLLFGGGQEKGFRSGTLNVPGIVGFGTACQIAKSQMKEEAQRVAALRDRLERSLRESVPSTFINGDIQQRLPGSSSLTFPHVEATALLANLPAIALSTSSACYEGTVAPSYVLKAIGLSHEDALATIRIGIGRFTKEEEIEIAANSIVTAYRTLLEST